MSPSFSNGQGYDPLPPIPTYDEAIAIAPPRSPVDGRPASQTEQESLLGHGAPSSSSRFPRGYRPPTVETDDEDNSDWESDSSEVEVRREMQEFDIEEPPSRSSWSKRIGQWSFNWRLRMPSIRLPRLGRSGQPPDTESGTVVPEEEEDQEPAKWWRRCFPAHPLLPQMNSTATFLLVARLLALILLLGFLYLLFMSDLFAGMARKMESRVFPPEMVRDHVQKSVNPPQMRDMLKEFTSYAHMAGTEGSFAQALNVERMFKGWGLEDVSSKDYYVYLNYPKEGGRAVEILDNDGKATWTAMLEEMEAGSEKAGHQTFVFHGYSKSGDVRGPLIYANYGSRDDFQKLKDAGIKTDGAIALVRYYGSQPDAALKVKAAEMAGFAGVLVYSDPADDGFVKGTTAPGGRYMPADGVQRSSVALSSLVLGDPLTPGWESRQGLPRMKPKDSSGLVKIPSLPIAWRDARVLLQHLKGIGQPVDDAWKGGVTDVEWWTGDSTSPIVRLKNENDEVEQQKITNVHAKIIGVEQPGKSIIIGNHRDAWASGAVEPGSGTAIFLEVARIFGRLLENGWRPRRSIVFMSWDAEEYNMVGSTEFVEDHLDALQRDGYVYINLDKAVSGGTLKAAGSPVFHMPLLRALNRVGDPNFNTTLRQLWNERGSQLEGLEWSGSDSAPFQAMAGTSSLDLSFVSDEPYPKHSSYDNFDFMDRIGDPGFIYHALLAEVVGLLLLELADNPILPFDLSAYAGSLEKWCNELMLWARDKGVDKPENGFTGWDILQAAVTDAAAKIKTFEAWAISWQNSVLSGGGWESTGLGEKRFEYNDRLAAFETALLDLEKNGGIPNRTQYKHVVLGPRLWSTSSSGASFFPAIRDAIEDGNWALANALTEKTARILIRAGDVLAQMDTSKTKSKRWLPRLW